MDSSRYKTTYDVKVSFSMLEFSSRKIITHSFHVYSTRGDEGIGYDMIIVRDLMVQLGLKYNFGRKILEWEETVVPMKEPGNFLGQT